MKKNSIKGKKTGGELVLDIFKVFFVLLVSIVCVYPFWNIFIISINDGQDALRGGLYFWPRVFTLENYQEILRRSEFVRAIGVTVLRTLIGTPLVVLVTSMLAYVLSRSELLGKKFWTLMFIFTMYFSGGMVPSYLLVKSLGLINTRAALVLVSGISIYNLIVTRTYFTTSISDSIYEAAKIDGAGELKTFLSIALPLAKPIVAVMVLYYAVAHWNDYFNALLYVSDKNLEPLQSVLRRVLIQNQNALDESMMQQSMQPGEMLDSAKRAYAAYTMKYTMVFIASAPLLIAYPFVQKYFVKGVMVGAVKE
mgnify:CR=1 FL=1